MAAEYGTPTGRSSRRNHEHAPDALETAWSRWAPPGEVHEVELLPIFPDRPVAVDPETPFHLLPGASARIYVRVPLWVQVGIPPANGGEKRLVLAAFPTVSLSDTWWGGMENGELAYWLETTARREMRQEFFEDHLAACPLVVTNHAASELRIEKLALRVAHLSLFVRDGELWSDECLVSYQGDQEGSQISVTGSPPSAAPDAVRIGAPRTPIHRGVRARTFGRLASISGWGGGGP